MRSMNDTWAAMAKRQGHERVEFLTEVWNSAKGWFPWSAKRRDLKKEVVEAKKAEAAYDKWFVKDKEEAKKEFVKKAKKELDDRKIIS